MLVIDARFAVLSATFLCGLLINASTNAHIDAVRVSLAQLYLEADVAGIVRIEAVEDYNFAREGQPALREVLTATMLYQYKGKPLRRVHFLLDAHGPAEYHSGDVAALFLETMNAGNPLRQLGPGGPEIFLSRQVRNSEHRMTADGIIDYRWTLSAYAQEHSGGTQQKPAVSELLLYMLGSGSDGLAESALIDWQNLGTAVDFSQSEIDELYTLTRDSEHRLSLRLSVLKILTAQKLIAATAWDPFFEWEEGDNLLAVIRATHGQEHKHFQSYLVEALESDDLALTRAAARALAHPIYVGIEPLMEPLLQDDDWRLNYAAVAALLGIGSSAGHAMLHRAANHHASAKVRRMIDARLRGAGFRASTE